MKNLLAISRVLLHMTSNSSRLRLAHFQQNRPVAGIDERLLLGGSLVYETAHSWQAATQA